MGAGIGRGPNQVPTNQMLGSMAFADFDGFYEEGFFTPRVEGSTAAGTATYTNQVGRFQRVGRRVDYQITLVYTGGTGTGNLLVKGLPFLASGFGSNGLPVASIHVNGLTFTGQLTAYIDIVGGQSTISINTISSNASGASVPYDTAAEIYVAGSYFIDAVS